MDRRLLDFYREIIKSRETRKKILVLAVLVVFVTTYILILPAFTLEKDKAAEQGGIDVPGVEATAETYGDSAEVADADGAKSADESDMSAADEDIEEQDVEYSSEEILPDEESAEADDLEDTSEDDATVDDPAGTSDDADEAAADTANDNDPAGTGTEPGTTSDEANDTGEAGDAAADEETEEVLTEVEGEDAAAEETDAQVEDLLTFEGEGYTVLVEDPYGVLPADTAVEVTELLENPEADTKAERKAKEEEYQNYYDKALEAVNDEAAESAETGKETSADKDISFVRFYDIKLMSGGVEIKPEQPVNVTITYEKEQQEELEVEKAEDVRIIHFIEDEETSEIEPEILKEEAVDVTLDQQKMAETTFEAENFSVYAVVYTVDFEYVSDVDGKTYEYSIKGGQGIGLSELLPVLGVIIDDKDTDVNEVDEFIGQIAEAGFSDPDLVSISKADEDTTIGAIKDALGLECDYSADLTEDQITEINSKKVKSGDWALISLRAFDTEETLTVTLKNGDQFTIKVTDARHEELNTIDELNGKTYALIGYDNALLTSTSNGNGTLRAQQVDLANVPSNSTKWKFEKDTYSNKFLIACDQGYLNVSEGNVSVSSYPQLLNVSMSYNQIRITDDYGFAVNLYESDVSNGFGAWRGYPSDNEYFSLYAFPAEIDPEKGYMIYVERNGLYYVLKNDLSTAVVSSQNDLNKLSKEHLWKFEQSGDNYIVHTFGLDEPSTLRIYYGYWGVDAESHHTNYLSVDGDNNSLIISGFGNPKDAIIFNEYTNHFEISNSASTELSLKEQNRYFFTVTTNNPMYGTVSGTNSDGTKVSDSSEYLAVTKAKNQDNEYKNNNSIQSTPMNGYYFDHWELDGEALDKTLYPQNLADNHVSIPKFGSELKAIFKKIQPPSSDDYPPHETPGYEVLSWLGEALNSKPIEGADKTAEVYDYENRIYRVDLKGHSGVKVIANDVDLAFVSDISNSMLFPEKLTAVTDSGDEEVSVVSNKTTRNSNLHSQLEDRVSQGLLERRGIDDPYIVIGDLSNSSTQYALFYSTGQWLKDHYFEEGWYALDASYFARWMAGADGVTYSSQQNRFFKLSDKYNLRGEDDEGYEYVIYEPNDYWEETFKGDDYLYARDPDNKFGANRLYYLVGSIKMATEYLQKLANNYPLRAVYTGLETFAGSTSTNTQEIINKTVGESTEWPDRHQDFVQIGGVTAYNNADYDANLDALIGKLTNITTKDGTAQDIAIQQMKNILHWPTTVSNAKKYVIMVTDGAPNRRKRQNNQTVVMPVEDVIVGVNGEKATGGSLDGAKLITVGLGINDVPGGQQLLHSVADDGLYYNAQDGNDLTLILLDIIRSLMENAVVTSDVHDEIDPTFYPVDRTTGLPIQLNGNNEAYIDLDGNVLDSKPADGAYGVLTCSNGRWQVDWTNQAFKPDDKGGWKGTFYVKAKEDFMGGIGMETNFGDATVTPTKYYVADEDGNPTGVGQNIPAPKDEYEEDKRTPVTMESPRVNVDELVLSEQSSEWTVYLGASVSPREQLQALYQDLMVQEVVTDTEGDNHKTNGGQTLYTITENSTADNTDPVSGHIPEEFALSSLPNMGINDIDWDQLISNGRLENIEYNYEGHNAGSFTIELIKKTEGIPEGTNSIDDDTGSPPSHVTNKTGEGVEEYTLRITYVPNSENIDKTYHTGSFGSGAEGKVTDDSKSTNVHTINVFAKKLQIFKVDQSQSAITGGNEATFGLYRLATAEEMNDASITKKALSGIGNCVLVQRLTTENGILTTDPLTMLKSTEDYDESYYLVEEEAPAGYNKLTDILKVTVDMSKDAPLDQNVWTKLADNSESNHKPNPFVSSDWEQNATIIVTSLNGETNSSAVRVIPEGQHGITYDHTNDTTDASVTYKIINNAGVELPHTGGIGTTVFYILGSMLVIGCGVLLISRRRINRES